MADEDRVPMDGATEIGIERRGPNQPAHAQRNHERWCDRNENLAKVKDPAESRDLDGGGRAPLAAKTETEMNKD